MSGVVVWWLLAMLSMSLATDDPSFSVDTKRYSHVVSDRFLSLTIDPTLLMDAEYSSGITKVMNLARGLAPAYVRLGSPASNRYQFHKAGTHKQHNASYAVTEAQWMILNDFAQKSGLEPIVCVNIMSRQGGSRTWDTRNLRDLVAYSDRRKYKLSWQMGYELQRYKNMLSGADLGNDVKILRSILDSFPRYQQSKILGPDIVSTNDPSDLRFLSDFLRTAGNALSAVTWHAFEGDNARFNGETNTLMAGENVLAEQLGKDFTSKPLWIADSYRDPDHPIQFEDGLSWAVKLGEAARIGVQTVLMRPQIHNLQSPTPDYWVSFLHKTLVGEVVLANDWIPSGEIHVFSHCTNTRKPMSNVFVNDQLRYEEGSMTFFAVNWLPMQVNISLRLSALTKRSGDVELHEYVLTPDSMQASHGFKKLAPQVPKVLLNGRPLSLDFTGRLPILTPRVHHYTNRMALTLPGRSVGFWVVSGAKVQACSFKDGGYHEGESREESLTRVKRQAGGTDEEKADVERDTTEAPEKTSKTAKKKVTPNSQIVMEIGNWNEGRSKTQGSKKSMDESNVVERSLNETESEVQLRSPDTSGDHLDENNSTVSKTFNEENTEKPKYRISKVLVVFENELEDQKTESHEDDKRALLVDEETVISNDEEFRPNRVSRALDKDSFPIPNIPLSLLDVAALREPLISLKRLREKRWEQLQRKKLLAAQEYKKSLSLQASMLFPKKWIAAVPVPKLTLVQPKVRSLEEQTNDYDYISEEEEEPEVEYSQQHTSQAQWNAQGITQNNGMPNNALSKHGQIWDDERGPMDVSPLQERQRYIRAYPAKIHIMDNEEVGQNENLENIYVYETSESELNSRNNRRAHFESNPSLGNTYQEVNSRHPTDKGCGELYHKPTTTHFDQEQAEQQYGNKRQAQALYRHGSHRDRRQLTQNKGSLAPLSAFLSDNQETYRVRKDVSAALGSVGEQKGNSGTVKRATPFEQSDENIKQDLSAVVEEGSSHAGKPTQSCNKNRKRDGNQEPNMEQNSNENSHDGEEQKIEERDAEGGQGVWDWDDEKNEAPLSLIHLPIVKPLHFPKKHFPLVPKLLPLKPLPRAHLPIPKLKPISNLLPKGRPYNSGYNSGERTEELPKLKPLPKIQPPSIHHIQDKISHMVNDLKSRTQSTLSDYENKKLLPLHLGKKTELSHIKDRFEILKHNAVSKLKPHMEKRDDDEASQADPHATGHETDAATPEKRDDDAASMIEHSLSNIKERFEILKHNAASKLNPQMEKRDDDEASKADPHATGHETDAATPEKRDDDAASMIEHSLSNIKERFEILKHNAASKLNPQMEKRDDDEASKADPHATGLETDAATPDKRDDEEASKVHPDATSSGSSAFPTEGLHHSVKRSQQELKENFDNVLTKLKNSIFHHEPLIIERSVNSKDVTLTKLKNFIFHHEPLIIERSVNSKDATTIEPEVISSTKSNDRSETLSDKDEEKDKEQVEKVEDHVLESTAQTNLEDIGHDRTKRHVHGEDKTSHNNKDNMFSMGERIQHSKKRFLKIKASQPSDSPENEGNSNDHAKPTDSQGINVKSVAPSAAVVSCPTDSNTPPSSSKCIKQQGDPFSTEDISSNTKEANANSVGMRFTLTQYHYEPIIKEVSQRNVQSVEDQSSNDKNSDNSKSDDSRSQKWKLTNNAFNTWRSIGHTNNKENKDIKSGKWPLRKTINQYDKNIRSKRYIDLSKGKKDSKELLNEKLTMVDSNSNEDSVEYKFKNTLSPTKHIPKFESIENTREDTGLVNKGEHNVLDAGKKSGNIERVFQDWNLALGPHGLQIGAEQAQDAQTFQGIGRTWRYDHTANPTGKNKVAPKELKTTYYSQQKTPSSVTHEDSHKLGFFGNFLKKIYSLFHLVFSKQTN